MGQRLVASLVQCPAPSTTQTPPLQALMESTHPGASPSPHVYVSKIRSLTQNHTFVSPRNRRQRIFGRGVTTLGSSLDPAEEAGMRARANDRALKNLGVRELNLGSLPEGAKIVNLPNQVRCGRAFIGLGQETPVVLHDRPCMNPRSTLKTLSG